MTPSRARRAEQSLQGLCVGDAFGSKFYAQSRILGLQNRSRDLPPPVWTYTDDTEMAIAILNGLNTHGRIHCDTLAGEFANRYVSDMERGYGRGAQKLLSAIYHGEPWEQAARAMFNGEGSCGNGAAMRVAPLGAWFADDLDRCVYEAVQSARVTHAHRDGQAGAVAVAVGAALATRGLDAREWLRELTSRSPAGMTRDGLERACSLPLSTPVRDAADILGCGERVLSEDTVPFSLWCAARHMDNYEEALWSTVSALGDRDTTCAIVGGIVALSAGPSSIPRAWLDATEPPSRE